MDSEQQLIHYQLTFGGHRVSDIRPFLKFVWMGSFVFVTNRDMKPMLTTYATKAHKRHRRRLLKTAVVVSLVVLGSLVALNFGKAFAHEKHEPYGHFAWDSLIEDQQTVQKTTCWHLMSKINEDLEAMLHSETFQVSKPTQEMLGAYDKFCKRY